MHTQRYQCGTFYDMIGHGGIGSNQYQTRGVSQAVPAINIVPPILPLDSNIGQRIANDHNSDPASLYTWAQLATATNQRGQYDWQIAYSIARNPSANADTLCLLVDKAASGIKAAIVEREDCPAPALQVMATDKSMRMRRQVARHPNTPVSTLMKLAQSKDRATRAAARTNPNVPDHVRAVWALS